MAFGGLRMPKRGSVPEMQALNQMNEARKLEIDLKHSGYLHQV